MILSGTNNKYKAEIRKLKSDVLNSQNNFFKKCSKPLRDCSRMIFRVYPVLYENKKELREFKLKRFIMR